MALEEEETAAEAARRRSDPPLRARCSVAVQRRLLGSEGAEPFSLRRELAFPLLRILSRHGELNSVPARGAGELPSMAT